jgi:predicted  nucleic acid-binding Zn-ribbon protein
MCSVEPEGQNTRVRWNGVEKSVVAVVVGLLATSATAAVASLIRGEQRDAVQDVRLAALTKFVDGVNDDDHYTATQAAIDRQSLDNRANTQDVLMESLRSQDRAFEARLDGMEQLMQRVVALQEQVMHRLEMD